MPAPTRRLLRAVRAANLPAALSHDAGRYLCNYLCWQAAAAAARQGPSIAAFVHVPDVGRKPLRKGKTRRFTLDDLTQAGSRLLAAVAAAARR
jgi:pyroglutamyl-peptidase